jgi:hypothetical protein
LPEELEFTWPPCSEMTCSLQPDSAATNSIETIVLTMINLRFGVVGLSEIVTASLKSANPEKKVA